MNSIVSIIICTRNRAESLRATLASFGRCQVPRDLPAELIVVDNGSTDDTRQVVESAGLPNMPVRYIHEPQTGQTFARNRGLNETAGAIVLFTDDDVELSPHWIDRMARPIRGGQGDAVVGNIRIADNLCRPWFNDIHRAFLASTEHFDWDAPAGLVGACMGFRREVLEGVPCFDTELGPGGLGFGDDTLFSMQVEAAGYRIIGAPEAEMIHHFDTNRLSRQSLLTRANLGGRSWAYILYHWIGKPRVRKKRVKRFLGSTWGRLRNRKGWPWEDGTPAWELVMARDLGFYEQWSKERQRIRKYAHTRPQKDRAVQTNIES